MPYRAMALVAASLLLATQSYAAKGRLPYIEKHTKQHGGKTNMQNPLSRNTRSTGGKTAKKMNPIQPVHLGNGTAIRNQPGISDNDRRTLEQGISNNDRRSLAR